MSGVPWAKITASTVGLMGVGWLLMKATVPTEEELYSRMAPDLQRKVDAARSARLAQEAAKKSRVPDNTKPVWAEPPNR